MGRYDHFAFQVSDMDKAIQFYVDKLGFALDSRTVDEEHGEEFAFLDLGDLRLELLKDLTQTSYHKPEIAPPYCPHLAIASDDLARTAAELRAARVRIIRGPLEIEGQATWLYLADPDNNMIEYVQWYDRA